MAPLRLTDIETPRLPGEGWVEVAPLLSGICGSDLSLLDGTGSRHFEPYMSFPFVPGHEIVGTLSSAGGVAIPGRSPLQDGERVVVEPVLQCAARGLDPKCESCAAGDTGLCLSTTHGHIEPGLMTGYCKSTGGGWSAAPLVAHASQLHAIPAGMDDTDAVIVEPAACAVHGALLAKVQEGENVAVVGAGTLGLLTIAAVRELTPVGSILAGAKYPHQKRFAVELGADEAGGREELARAVRRKSHSHLVGGDVVSGADVVFDCVASRGSILQSLSLLRPRGRLVLVGMPARMSLDFPSVWHRELSITGSYTYGVEDVPRGRVRTFELAIELAGRLKLGRLVTAAYPLERYEEAVMHAATAGSRGAVKIVFNPQARPSRPARSGGNMAAGRDKAGAGSSGGSLHAEVAAIVPGKGEVR